MKNSCEIKNVLLVKLVYKKEKLDDVHNWTMDVIEQGLFLEILYSGPKRMENVNLSGEYNTRTLLVSSKALSDLTNFCKENGIEVL